MLREQLHSNGVVISDDMQMEVIVQYDGYEQVMLLAREKGMDVLAIANQVQYHPDIAAKPIAMVLRTTMMRSCVFLILFAAAGICL